jgi:hypothetical protein
LRWSSTSPAGIAAYVLAALLALFEIGALWLALNPDVPNHFRAYYIDRTTTCLPQPVTGEYELGAEIDFRSGGDPTRELRPCGWDGPAGDGMHSIGSESRLRFAVGEAQPLTLMLELTGVGLPGPAQQRVRVSVNGTELGEILVTPEQTERFELPVPATALEETGYAEVLLHYPDAIQPGPRVADIFWRSVKLTAAALRPQLDS